MSFLYTKFFAEKAQNRIAICAGSLSPGGAENQLTLTAINLAKMGHKVAVITPHYTPNDPAHMSLDLEGSNAHFAKRLIDHGVELRIGYSYPRDSIKDSSGTERLGLLNRFQADDIAGEKAGYFKIRIGPLISGYIAEFQVWKPDIVHCWQDGINIFAGLAAVIENIPVILSARNVSPIRLPYLHSPEGYPYYQALMRQPNVTPNRQLKRWSQRL